MNRRIDRWAPLLIAKILGAFLILFTVNAPTIQSGLKSKHESNKGKSGFSPYFLKKKSELIEGNVPDINNIKD
jgi:hypothetical protein